MIEAKKVDKIYSNGKVHVNALRNISLSIKNGEFVAIMGASGSGKSTLLNQLGLLDNPTSGNIYIDDIDIVNLRHNEKIKYRLNNLGYVFQDYALLPELTALENVSLPLRMLGIETEEVIARSKEIIKLVGLEEREDHLPKELSGGEQQRVSIARALVHKPKILFADEPCANLDSISSDQILKLFARFNKELKQTIIMVTHEEWHTKYVHRIIRLHDGMIMDKIKKNQ